ncbi:hypothetical protein [Adhaeribacter soli]|uniref:Uncharacterized protein n=1 Tax=Adhaeribacter soli TaxID=2607655 RepID=A0A5N1IUY3_9BACT|nr:hypothetical protein [Adhaeribacter soli]KAA9331860.1 hypothetical protein F0P94_13765 [Adhaeribacter soli]
MKNALSFLLPGLVAATGFISSCVNDSTPNPRAIIDFNPKENTIALAPGDSVNKLAITVSSMDRLQSFTIGCSDSAKLLHDTIPFPARKYNTVLLDKIAASKVKGDRVVYTFTAVTERNETTSRTYTVKVEYPKAVIDFSPKENSISLATGDSINKLTITVSSRDKLKSFTATSSEASQPLHEAIASPANKYTYKLREKVAANKVKGSQIVYTFTTITERNEITTRTYTVNVK